MTTYWSCFIFLEGLAICLTNLWAACSLHHPPKQLIITLASDISKQQSSQPLNPSSDLFSEAERSETATVRLNEKHPRLLAPAL